MEHIILTVLCEHPVCLNSESHFRDLPGTHCKARFPRPELTARVDDRFTLPVNTGRVDGRAFPLAELTGRVEIGL